jgi:hypothetical protein
MLPSAQSPWVVLRWRRRSDGLWLSYEDSTGIRIRPPRRAFTIPIDWRVADIPTAVLGDRAYAVLVPAMLADHLSDRAAELPETLGVFVQSRPGLPPADGEALAERIIQPILGPERFQIVRLRYRPWTRHPPFRLPFRILVGDDAAMGVADELRAMGWLEDDVVQRYGMRIDVRAWGQPLANALLGAPYDILIAEGGAPTMRMLARRMPRGAHRPRLIISLEHGPLDPSVPVPAGVSLLRVPGRRAAAWTAEFILGLVHDQPLHEALRSAQRTRSGDLDGDPVLIADPFGDQSLRIADARYQVLEEVTRLRIKSAPYTQAAFGTDAVGVRAESALRDQEDALATAMDESHRAAFDRESSGLWPLARAEAALVSAYDARRAVLDAVRTRDEGGAASTTWGDEGTDEAADEKGDEERRVDVALERPVVPGVFDPVDPLAPLDPGGTYRLRVHVGTPLPESLVVGEVPPITPLLGVPDDDRGHLLEVVVFPKRFGLLSPAVQPLRLPLHDSSDPVFFTLRAPEQAGDADLRIAVYHRDHMVQAFRLSAPVGERLPTGAEGVTVRLDFATTQRLSAGDLELLRERAFCLGVNQDAGGGSHSFMVKRAGAASDFSLTQKVVEEQVDAFRKLLQDATFVPPVERGKARFSTYPPAGAASDPEFLGYVRQLADFGSGLHKLLFNRVSPSVQRQLRTLRKESDRVIQVVRHDVNLAFPWGIIYDYPLGTPITGAPPRPVCLGEPLPGLGPAPETVEPRGCPHNPGHDVYCVDGFWGVRHRLEQRFGRAETADPTLRRPAGRPGVMLATGIGDDSATELAARLGEKLGAELVTLGKDDNLMGLLWDPARRPAVLIILGHLETRAQDGHPAAPRIALLPRSSWADGKVPEAHWLLADGVTNMFIGRDAWSDDPHTLVLLMACSSAATEVGTVNDLVTALVPVGVGAVVGTETPVFSRLAARFAQEVTLALWSDSTRTLGEAVQSFNRTLIRSGNPLAFAFTCVGNADLTLAT